jgi:hypothetical protein
MNIGRNTLNKEILYMMMSSHNDMNSDENTMGVFLSDLYQYPVK